MLKTSQDDNGNLIFYESVRTQAAMASISMEVLVMVVTPVKAKLIPNRIRLNTTPPSTTKGITLATAAPTVPRCPTRPVPP